MIERCSKPTAIIEQISAELVQVLHRGLCCMPHLYEERHKGKLNSTHFSYRFQLFSQPNKLCQINLIRITKVGDLQGSTHSLYHGLLKTWKIFSLLKPTKWASMKLWWNFVFPLTNSHNFQNPNQSQTITKKEQVKEHLLSNFIHRIQFWWLQHFRSYYCICLLCMYEFEIIIW